MSLITKCKKMGVAAVPVAAVATSAIGFGGSLGLGVGVDGVRMQKIQLWDNEESDNHIFKQINLSDTEQIDNNIFEEINQLHGEQLDDEQIQIDKVSDKDQVPRRVTFGTVEKSSEPNIYKPIGAIVDNLRGPVETCKKALRRQAPRYIKFAKDHMKKNGMKKDVNEHVVYGGKTEWLMFVKSLVKHTLRSAQLDEIDTCEKKMLQENEKVLQAYALNLVDKIYRRMWDLVDDHGDAENYKMCDPRIKNGRVVKKLLKKVMKDLWQELDNVEEFGDVEKDLEKAQKKKDKAKQEREAARPRTMQEINRTWDKNYLVPDSQ